MARRLEARPGPAFTPWASCPALASINAETAPNFARNSPATVSNIEFRSLELQRFRTLLKLRPIELRARFRGGARLRNGVRTGALVAFSVQRVAGLKPPSPLLARNVCAALWASKGVAGFMRTRERASKGGFIWARKSSPCGAVSSRKREEVRPARSKHPKFGVFRRAGRVFSRKGRWRGRAGRVFSRKAAGGAVLGELFRGRPLEGPCWANSISLAGAPVR